jgi:hypothetical protein
MFFFDLALVREPRADLRSAASHLHDRAAAAAARTILVAGSRGPA